MKKNLISPAANLFDRGFEDRVMMARDHVAQQHAYIAKSMPEKDPGVFCIAVRKTDEEVAADKKSGRSYNRWFQYFGSYSTIQRRLPEILYKHRERDVYMLVNTVYQPRNSSPRRVDENVRQLRSLWVDIDCYKQGLRAHDVLNDLEKKVFGKELPWPSRVVFSGGVDGGLWLFWDLEPVPYKNRYAIKNDGNESMQPVVRWRGLQRQFAFLLKDYGVDTGAIDTVRVCRLAGTYNSKTGELAETLAYDDELRYDLSELADQYLPKFDDSKKRVQRSKWKPNTSKTDEKDGNRVSPWLASYFEGLSEDLRKLCKLRNGNMKGKSGSEVGREVLLFQFRHFREMAHGDRDQALQEALELNSTLKDPLPMEEIRDTTPRVGKVYRYRRSRLLAMYKVTLEEQRELNLLVGGEIKQERKREYWRGYQAERRAKAGITSRAERKEATLSTLAAALKNEPDATVRRLAEATGLSPATCSRYREAALEELFHKPHLYMVQLSPSGEVFDECVPSDLNSSLEALPEVACSSDEISAPVVLSESHAHGLWLRILRPLVERLEFTGRAATAKAWLSMTEPLSFDGYRLLVRVANSFAKEWIERRIQADVDEVSGTDLCVTFVV